MKFCTLVLMGLLLCAGSYGQSEKNASNYNPNVDSVAEALVAMAMNNPSIKSNINLAKQFQYLYKASKTSWLNNIAIQGNVNEFSFKNNNANDPLKASTQYPKYNFGVVIPFGMFINNPKQAKADYYKYQYALEQVNVEKQNVRREVLLNWNDYKMNKALLGQHQQLVNDWRIIHVRNEQKFSNGEISLEAFYNSTKTYTDELNKQENLNSALRATAAKLEALIGMNIEDALTQISIRRESDQNRAPAQGNR
ncbi:MAG: TolC family protein [Bacteroidetes bacterium]|nr:TolC family protein [Bacteroidota bacterium]